MLFKKGATLTDMHSVNILGVIKAHMMNTCIWCLKAHIMDTYKTFN